MQKKKLDFLFVRIKNRLMGGRQREAGGQEKKKERIVQKIE